MVVRIFVGIMQKKKNKKKKKKKKNWLYSYLTIANTTLAQCNNTIVLSVDVYLRCHDTGVSFSDHSRVYHFLIIVEGCALYLRWHYATKRLHSSLIIAYTRTTLYLRWHNAKLWFRSSDHCQCMDNVVSTLA